MTDAYIVAGARTPMGRYAGALATVRADDLAAHAIKAALGRVQGLAAADVDEVVLGCANQAGEDNRNVARMSSLLAGLPVTVPAVTINRLCGSGADAVSYAARAIRCGEAHVVVAGGVESMSRAPFVVAKSPTAFGRAVEMYDTTIGWRFVNPRLDEMYGSFAMPETAEEVAADFAVSRADQDAFAARSQHRTAAAQDRGRLAREIAPLQVPPAGRGEPRLVEHDEHPRATSVEALARLKPIVRPDGTVTAGNSSGVNDGAAALVLMSSEALERSDAVPLARVSGAATAGVEPRIMGMGPVPASRRLLERADLKIADIDVVELNEAFAAQAVAVLRELGLPEDAEHVNPNGGAIALGHPLGMSGARLTLTAALELAERGASRAMVTMCIGVGQGISLLLERP